MSAVHFDNFTDARNHFKDVLDAAEAGRSTTIRRDSVRVVVIETERLRHFLASVTPSRAELVAEGGGWSMFIPGLPVAVDGTTLDETVDEMVDALREYAEDWNERLSTAPNHVDNWGLVQLISLSSATQLRDWLVSRQQ